jgi:hypothetical protein
MNLLNKYIKKQMVLLDLNESQLAKKSGVVKQKLNLILNNNVPTYSQMPTFVKLAHFFQVAPEYLVILNQKMSARSTLNSKYPKDHSGFVSDVTIPDDTIMKMGEVFEKTWKIQNLGKHIWQNRFLICANSDDKLSHYLEPACEKISIKTTEPFETVEITVKFTAPQHPDTYISYWKMHDIVGDLCFPSLSGLFCRIIVL